MSIVIDNKKITDINISNKNVQKIVKKTGVEILELNDLSNLTENQRNSINPSRQKNKPFKKCKAGIR